MLNHHVNGDGTITWDFTGPGDLADCPLWVLGNHIQLAAEQVILSPDLPQRQAAQTYLQACHAELQLRQRVLGTLAHGRDLAKEIVT